MKLAKQDCVHYWKIEPPTDLESEGRCARCGLHKTFSNRPLEARGEMTDWKRGTGTGA
jgi:hypothetical protein